MDYSYIKKEAENEKNMNRKNFLRKYDQQYGCLIEILSKSIVSQVKTAIKNYYMSSEPHYKRLKSYNIKSPTLFKKDYTYECKSQYVIFKMPDDWNIPYNNLYGVVSNWGDDVPCMYIPESKFEKFINLLNKQLIQVSIHIQLKPSEYATWYEINIVANVGKL